MNPRGTEIVRVSLDLPASAFVTFAAPPEFISQHTVERELGVPARSYLEDIGGPGYDAEVIRRGKLRLARRSDYIDYLRRRSVQQRATAEAAGSDGADGVLADMGLRVLRGAK